MKSFTLGPQVSPGAFTAGNQYGGGGGSLLSVEFSDHATQLLELMEQCQV